MTGPLAVDVHVAGTAFRDTRRQQPRLPEKSYQSPFSDPLNLESNLICDFKTSRA